MVVCGDGRPAATPDVAASVVGLVTYYSLHEYRCDFGDAMDDGSFLAGVKRLQSPQVDYAKRRTHKDSTNDNELEDPARWQGILPCPMWTVQCGRCGMLRHRPYDDLEVATRLGVLGRPTEHPAASPHPESSLATGGVPSLRNPWRFPLRGNAKTRQTQPQPEPSTEDGAWLEQDGTDEAVAEVMSDRMTAKANREPGTEVMRNRLFTDNDLSDIESWDQVLAMATAVAEGDTIPNAADVLGTGFRIADEDDKIRLQGVPLVLLQWFINDGDFGPFVSINAVQRHDNGSITKWVINDGSTGICQQLTAYEAKTGSNGPLAVPKGLRASNYYIDGESGQPLTKAEVAEYISAGRKPVPAHTFYLDTSA